MENFERIQKKLKETFKGEIDPKGIVFNVLFLEIKNLMVIYNSDIYFFYQKSVFLISEKKFIELKPSKWDEYFQVTEIKMNRLGTCLSLIGKTKVMNLIIDKSQLNLQRKGILQFPLIPIGEDKLKIYQVEYHPMSDIHLLILSDDHKLRVYNLTVNNLKPEQTIDLVGIPISFCFATKFNWNVFSIFYITFDGNLYLIHTLIPYQMKISKSLIKDLESTEKEIKDVLRSILGENLKNDYIQIKKHSIKPKIIRIAEKLVIEPIQICSIYGGNEHTFFGIYEKSKSFVAFGFFGLVNPFLKEIEKESLKRLCEFDLDLETTEKKTEDMNLFSFFLKKELVYSYSKFGLVEMKLPMISEIEEDNQVLSNGYSRIVSENKIIGLGINGDYAIFIDNLLNIEFHQISSIQPVDKLLDISNQIDISYEDIYDIKEKIGNYDYGKLAKGFEKLLTNQKTPGKTLFDQINGFNIKKLEHVELFMIQTEKKVNNFENSLKKFSSKKRLIDKITQIEMKQEEQESKYKKILKKEKELDKKKEKILKERLKMKPNKEEIEAYFILEDIKLKLRDMEDQFNKYQSIQRVPSKLCIDFSPSSFQPILETTSKNIELTKKIIDEIRKVNI